MELEKGKDNVLDLRKRAGGNQQLPPLTFDKLYQRCFTIPRRTTLSAPLDVRIGKDYIVRPRLDENTEVDWIEVCGEIIWKIRNKGYSHVGLEMYYDDSKKVEGFSDAVRVIELPKHMKGQELDKGIGQIMYQHSKDFMRFGFPDLVKENDDTFLDVSWKRHFKNAGYHIVGSIRPL